jgi:hypothetical protein
MRNRFQVFILIPTVLTVGALFLEAQSRGTGRGQTKGTAKCSCPQQCPLTRSR